MANDRRLFSKVIGIVIWCGLAAIIAFYAIFVVPMTPLDW